MTIDPQTIAIYDEKTDEYATLTEGVPHDLCGFTGTYQAVRAFWIMDVGQAPQPRIWQNRATLQMPLMHLKKWSPMRKNIRCHRLASNI